MDIPDLCAYSIYVSNILTANGIKLPIVKLKRDESKYASKILNIFNGHHKGPKIMPCGSNAEGLAMLAGRADLSSSDQDVILFASIFKVCEVNSEIEAFCFSHPMSYPILRIPDATCPGYSKLVLLKMSSELSKYCKFKGPNCFLKNSLKEHVADNLARTYMCHYTIHGPAVNVELLSQTTPFSHRVKRKSRKKFVIENKDYVLCLKGKSWPLEAYEWQTRHRPSNWPPKELFDNIIKSGYVLAAVGNKQSEESEIQWRISFNRAEQLIIESFNETQIYCLILLKLLKGSNLSKLAGKSITSYTMKTIMFWSLDELPNSFWQPFNLLFCFLFCLKKLKFFVFEKFLPDYFIRERNHFNLSEFTGDQQIRTEHYLNCFLMHPRENIFTLLYFYNLNSSRLNVPNTIVEGVGQAMFIIYWLFLRISMAEHYHYLVENSFSNLYDGYNVENVLLRCNDVNDRLTRIDYAQPFIKLLQNCKCVLQYVLLKKEKGEFGHITDSDKRRQCLQYMESSLAADRTNTPLRVATCLLDDDVEESDHCFSLIRSVTVHSKSHLYNKPYSDVLKETFENSKIIPFEKMQPVCLVSEIPIYNQIIKHDLVHQDPYGTIKQFKLFKEQGYQVGLHSTFLLVWEQCWFDVTFMLAELPVLPKPAALELCIDNTQKKISFHPFLYGLLLEFLWHQKYCSGNEEKESVLTKMENCISDFPDDHKFTGLNFLTYCYSLKHDYRSASKHLLMPFKEINCKDNKLIVTYLYIKYIINLLRMPSQGLRWPSKSCRQKTREHQIFVAIINVSHFGSLLNPLGHQGIVVFYC